MMRSRLAKLGIGVLAVLAVTAGPASANGMLGIFFDEYGTTCSGNVRQGGISTLYVVFLPAGDSRSGMTGVEFRIKTEDADGFNVLNSEPLLLTGLGDPFLDGINVVSGECISDVSIPILRITIQSLSGGSNAKFVVQAREPAANPNIPCALVTLCDAPIYTALCVETGKAVINPTGTIACGSNSESAEWSRIKGLYR